MSRLIEFDSSTENSVIMAEIRRRNFASQKIDFWHGITDGHSERQWVLESNGKDVVFPNWGYGEPCNAFGGKVGHATFGALSIGLGWPHRTTATCWKFGNVCRMKSFRNIWGQKTQKTGSTKRKESAYYQEVAHKVNAAVYSYLYFIINLCKILMIASLWQQAAHVFIVAIVDAKVQDYWLQTHLMSTPDCPEKSWT